MRKLESIKGKHKGKLVIEDDEDDVPLDSASTQYKSLSGKEDIPPTSSTSISTSSNNNSKTKGDRSES